MAKYCDRACLHNCRRGQLSRCVGCVTPVIGLPLHETCGRECRLVDAAKEPAK